MLSFFACKRDHVNPSSNSYSEPEIVDGRMKFNSINDFGNYIKNIKELPQASSSGKKTFISYHEYQHTRYIISENGRISGDSLERASPPDTTYIPDSFLASVLNIKREISFGGDSIYKFGSDYTFVYLPQDTAFISQFYQDVKNKIVSIKEMELYLYKNKIRVAKTVQSILTFSDTATIQTTNGRTSGEIGANANFSKENCRLNSQVWSTSWFFYASCGAKTFGQKKVKKRVLWWFDEVWEETNLDYSDFSFTANVDVAVPQFKNNKATGVTGSFTGGGYFIEIKKDNRGSTYKVFADMTGIFVPRFTLINVKSIHNGIRLGERRQLVVTGDLY